MKKTKTKNHEKGNDNAYYIAVNFDKINTVNSLANMAD